MSRTCPAASMMTVEYVNSAGDTIEVEVPDIEDLVGSAYDDILVGAHGPNRLGGYHGDDELYGREGDDWLDGGPGADRLWGGPDDDMLHGGEGDDGFVIAAAAGNDTVLDFGDGADRIDLAAFAEIQSLEDLKMAQGESGVMIDLSAHGSGTVTPPVPATCRYKNGKKSRRAGHPGCVHRSTLPGSAAPG